MGNTSSENTCTELSVLSWNIWFGTSQKLDQPEQRWTELLNIVVNKNPDLIGLQECTLDFLKVVKKHSRFSDHYVVVNERPLYSNYFVMLYKKKDLKILKKGTIKLKTTLERQCEYMDVEKEGAKFRFGTVHIESYVTSPNIREIQMGAIFDVLQKKTKDIELAFLVGDFNFHETDEENKFIESSQFKDTWRVVHEDLDGFTKDSDHNVMNQMFHGKPITQKKKRIDRILYMEDTNDVNHWKATQCQVIGDEIFDEIVMHDQTKVSMFPSDHYGLLAKFEKNLS
eukprot:TCONS_00001371-protein